MAIKFEQVDMDLEVMPSPAQATSGTVSVGDILRVLRSSAFREALRPLIVEIVGSELERARRRFG